MTRVAHLDRTVTSPDGRFTLEARSVAGSAAYFPHWDAQAGLELWKSDGTSAGTVQVTAQAYPGFSGPTPRGWLADALYFTTFDDRLWRSDGTAAGTSDLGPLHSLHDSSSPRDGVGLGGSLLFVAGSATSSGLASSDGTAAGTFSGAWSCPSSGRAMGRLLAPWPRRPSGRAASC